MVHGCAGEEPDAGPHPEYKSYAALHKPHDGVQVRLRQPRLAVVTREDEFKDIEHAKDHADDRDRRDQDP